MRKDEIKGTKETKRTNLTKKIKEFNEIRKKKKKIPLKYRLLRFALSAAWKQIKKIRVKIICHS